MASPQNTGLASDQATRPPATAASSPNPTRVPGRTAAAVGGDGDPEPRSAGQHVRRHDAELLEGAWPAGFDDDIGRVHETSQQFTLAGIVEVEGDGPL